MDLGAYIDNKEFTSIPEAGRYVVQAPDSFPSSAFSRTQKGALSVSIDPTIVGPTNEGFKLRFAKVSATVFKRNGKNASQVGDYLRAVGVNTGTLSNEQDIADAVEQTAGRTYQVNIDWRAYNKETKYSLEGMERFPSDGNGGYLPFTTDPNAFEMDDQGNVLKDENGNPVHKRIRANVFVSRFVPAGE